MARSAECASEELGKDRENKQKAPAGGAPHFTALTQSLLNGSTLQTFLL